MQRYGIGVLLGVIFVIPVVGIISLLHELIGHAHLPIELLHSSFGLVVTDAVLFAEQAFVMVPYFVWGILLCMIAYIRWSRKTTPAGFLRAVKIGLLFALPLTMIVIALLETRSLRIFAIVLLFCCFICWGWAYVWAYNQFRGMMNLAGGQKKVFQALMDRRQFLLSVGGTATSLALVTGGIGQWLHLTRRGTLAAKAQLPDAHPIRLKAQVYSTIASFQFPEQQFSRYQPSQQPIGVCFSGGGGRSTSASLGQMRGLHALGLLDSIGCLSTVSGGTWFSVLFNYAPAEFDDTTLLGAIIEPEEITVENLAYIDPHTIAAPMTAMTGNNLLFEARHILRTITFSDTASFNRFYSRLLNEAMLKPFALDHPHKSFTLNEQSQQQISRHNPSLTADDFYLMRDNRPYLVCGATQFYPTGPDNVMRLFEYTPLYCGMARFFAGEGHQASDLGGGYIESFAFDSVAPLQIESSGLVTLTTPEPLFLLSDMLGSSSAAPGMMLNHYNIPELMPKFNLWSLVGQEKQDAFNYSIVDGANLENLGLIPLLRRHYPTILAFVNSGSPLGEDNSVSINGIDSSIGRLFGFQLQNNFKQQDVQVFPSEQFEPLAVGLKAAREKGELPLYVDSYEIMQPNAFDIPSYPGDGKVKVVWFYNDLNETWLNKLSPEVKTLLQSSHPTNRLDNFPHFLTVGQNQTEDGAPELLYYSAEQINLLSHMWCYNIMHDAKKLLLSLTSSTGAQ